MGQDADKNFYVSIGSYDGAEVCELVGLHLLTLSDNFEKTDVGLYRDDGLYSHPTQQQPAKE